MSHFALVYYFMIQKSKNIESSAQWEMNRTRQLILYEWNLEVITLLKISKNKKL